ncbi:MAG: hypothetical protein ACRECO_01245 [Xanthobacteraceae bacterium]
MLRGAVYSFALLSALMSAAVAADSAVRVELNTAETAQKRCRLTFVIENKSAAVESFKLDMVVFDREGVVHHRMVTEMGPVRANKTIVRTFSLEGECTKVGSVLVNDVSGCTPGTPDGCLEGLTLASRVKDVRLYK